jgi:hypothetical protein
MHSIHTALAMPQLHSADWRVRLREPALSSIVFEHVCSMQDFSMFDETLPLHRAARGAGVTEWQGRSGSRLVSLGWDWLRLHDGALVADTSSPPRSNILLIDRQGYDMSLPETDDGLWKLIHALPWQRDTALGLAESA